MFRERVIDVLGAEYEEYEGAPTGFVKTLGPMLKGAEFDISTFSVSSSVYWIFDFNDGRQGGSSTFDILKWLRSQYTGKEIRYKYNDVASIVVIDAITAGHIVVDTHSAIDRAVGVIRGEGGSRRIQERRVGFIRERSRHLDGPAAEYLAAHRAAIADGSPPAEFARYFRR